MCAVRPRTAPSAARLIGTTRREVVLQRRQDELVSQMRQLFIDAGRGPRCGGPTEMRNLVRTAGASERCGMSGNGRGEQNDGGGEALAE